MVCLLTKETIYIESGPCAYIALLMWTCTFSVTDVYL